MSNDKGNEGSSEQIEPNEFVMKVGKQALSPKDLKKVEELVDSIDVFRKSKGVGEPMKSAVCDLFRSKPYTTDDEPGIFTV